MPRRRRVVQICGQFLVCWPQRSSTGSFCGLQYNPIRFQRLFLPTFSGKAEKVGRRRHSCSVTANSAVPVKPDRWADSVAHPYRLRRKNVCETMVGPRRKTKNTPVPVSRDESVCFVVPPLFRGQRPPSLRTDGAEAPAISAQRALYADSADVLRAPHRRSLTAKRLPL